MLDEDRIPRSWYNIVADLPVPPPAGPPPGHQASRSGPPTWRRSSRWRSSPRRSARSARSRSRTRSATRTGSTARARSTAPAGSRRSLDTPAHIYYKYEGVSPGGSHKPNTAIAQAFYNKEEGVKRLATETGAGQWGTALAIAGALFGLEVKVYMVRASYDQKPYRRMLMETYGAVGRREPVADDGVRPQRSSRRRRTTPARSASRSARRSRTRRRATTRSTRSGSVLNHVLLHQTVIGQEALEQMEMAGEEPDILIALHRRRLELRRAHLPVPRAASSAARPATGSSPSSPRRRRR